MRRAARALLQRGSNRDNTLSHSLSQCSITNSTATQQTKARNLDDIPRTINSNEHATLESPQHISNDGFFDKLESSNVSSYINGEEDHDKVYSLAKDLDGALNLRDTSNVDQATTYAPAVTHEHVHPHVHEIKEEQIYRDIHNQDVYHRIQPVYDVEILPARHFVPGLDGSLIEVSEDELPDFTSTNKTWPLGENPSYTITSHPRDPTERTRIPCEKRCTTPEGLERTETTIVHTPTLEDISLVGDLALPVYFDKHGHGQEMPIRELVNDVEHVQNSHRATLEEAKDNIQHLPSLIPDQLVPPRHASNGKGVDTVGI